VKPTAGEGTEFTKNLPYKGIPDLNTISVYDIVSPLVDTTKKFMKELIGVNLSEKEVCKLKAEKRLYLKALAAFINLKGAIEGKVILSVEENLARKVAKSFLMGDFQEGEEEEYMEDALGETLNTIVGNSIRKFPGLEDAVLIEAPTTLRSEKASVSYANMEIWTHYMEFDGDELSLSLITTDGLLNTDSKC